MRGNRQQQRYQPYNRYDSRYNKGTTLSFIDPGSLLLSNFDFLSLEIAWNFVSLCTFLSYLCLVWLSILISLWRLVVSIVPYLFSLFCLFLKFNNQAFLTVNNG